MASDSIDIKDLPLDKSQDPAVLDPLLSLLFEPTPALHNLLVPSVISRLEGSPAPASYADLIDVCSEVASGWKWEDKADFIAGHPMIGAPKVGGLSGKEQGAGPITPQVVLDRLAHLNALYCKVYPGLRFVTFVNGRPRQAIVNEMEAALGLTVSPDPLPADYPATSPALDSAQVEGAIKSRESDEWKKECSRGLADVWLIGKSRLKTLRIV